MTPVRLAKVTDGFTPVTAWKALRAGTHPADARRRFAAAARATDVGEVAGSYLAADVSILLPGSTAYPSMLVGDPGAPAVLFARGDPTVLEHRARVAVVGTRSATPYGRQVASELAADLAGEGVIIVSGLARGIDAAAHAGVVRALDDTTAPPVGVVGTGLDEIYPASSRALWEEVAARGAVLSESPLGTRPRPGVFPARNRIIAALSDVVVVVESHLRGGSLYTAEAAARRGIPVCAVPGSVRSASSSGTNALLVDGCIPVRDATDVLVAVSLACAGGSGPMCSAGAALRGDPETGPEVGPREHRSVEPLPATGRRRRSVATGVVLTSSERRVLEALDDIPTAFETILLRTDLSIAAAAEACDRLVQQGSVAYGPGWWCKN
jgi:DNA processing protein